MARQKKLKARPRESIHEIRAAGRESEGKARKKCSVPRGIFLATHFMLLSPPKIACDFRGGPGR